MSKSRVVLAILLDKRANTLYKSNFKKKWNRAKYAKKSLVEKKKKKKTENRAATNKVVVYVPRFTALGWIVNARAVTSSALLHIFTATGNTKKNIFI